MTLPITLRSRNGTNDLRKYNLMFGRPLLVICSLAMLTPAIPADAIKDKPKPDRQAERNQQYHQAEYKLATEIGWNAKASVIAAISRDYPGFHITSACTGTFRKLGDKDIALALFNEDKQIGEYVVGLGEHHTDFVALNHIDDPFNQIKWSPGDVYATCNSRTEIERIYKSYGGSSPEVLPTKDKPKPINNMDAVCVVPADETTGFACYQYDGKAKKFVDIGGWFND
jgi:hypothetical protein